MFKKNALLRALLAAGLTTGLAACGGGSSGGSDTPPNDPPPPTGPELTGQFVDSPVGGLEYLRSNKGAEVYLTNDDGQFNYQENETVTFKIGQLTLGSTQGGKIITPRNLASEAGATNVARVLQTLDDDGDPTNGITISAEVRSKAAKTATPRNIAETSDLDAIANEITDLASDSGQALVSANKAEAHLEETLFSISGSEVTSCSDEGAEQMSASDFNDLTLGMIADDETLLFDFQSGGTFTEYNSGDDGNIGAVTWNGSWSYDNTTQHLTLDFINEYDEQDGDEFRICAAGNRVIAEPENGVSYLYKLNQAVNGTRVAGTYLLQYPDETGAIMELRENTDVRYFQGEDAFTAAAALTFESGKSIISWGAEEPNDELYFLSGQATRTAIYIDFGENGEFARIGIAKSIPPITNATPTEADLIGKTQIFRSDADNDLVVFQFKEGGVYTDIYNDSYNNDVRTGAGIRSGRWSIVNGVLTLTEQDANFESFRVALGQTTMYYALESESDINSSDINRIDSVSLAKPTTLDSFVGVYSIDIPTEGAVETLTINEGNTCDYSGTGCNWQLDQNGKATITFGSGNDATGHVWQMANRSNGFAFVMTHQNDATDIEPGFMTRK